MTALAISPAEHQAMEWAHQVAEGKNPFSHASEEKNSRDVCTRLLSLWARTLSRCKPFF